jgi:hypothetical protein
MASLIVTESELKRLARNSGSKFDFNAKGFILLSFGRSGQHHIRLDLEKYENGRYNRMASPTSYEFQVSSFHIKREAYYSREEQDYDYLYFAYVGTGVWQPVWGYRKTETLRGGYRPRQDSGGADAWGDGTSIARDFLADLSEVTGTGQGMAMGPVQGGASNLVGIL